MKSIKFRLTGTNPLMLNNDQTVNPFNHYAKELKQLTSKRTKTEEDMEEIFRLKFLASWYTNDSGQYIIKSEMLSKALWAGAKENKLGAKFERSVFINGDALLIFDNMYETPAELYENHAEKYVDIRPVVVQKAKIPTARAIVPQWKIEHELTFDESQINEGEIWNALNIAGLRYGIGTYRKTYGRFSVEEIKDDKKKASKKAK